MKPAEFFDLFDGVKTIQSFDDRKVRKDLAKIFHFTNFSVVVETCLEYLNSQGAGIFFCVNETDGKGRTGANVVRVRAIYADLDGAPLEKALEYSPSLVVESSPNKYHVYFFVKDVPLQAFKTLQQSVIRVLNSDPAIHDLPRVLRVPGYLHNKNEPFRVNVKSCSGDIFNYRELTEWFPPLQVPQWSAKKYVLDKKTPDKKFNGKYGASNGERNRHLARVIGGMIKRGLPWHYIENEAMKEALACTPPLTESETRATLKSLQRYANNTTTIMGK